MYLKFIGKDGSMGLRHGKFYNTKIFLKDSFIYVQWLDYRGTSCKE